MTKNDVKAAESEIRKTIQWLNEESYKISADMDKQQGNLRKFDSGNAPYRELHKEFAKRLNEIGEKYGLIFNNLPNKIK